MPAGRHDIHVVFVSIHAPPEGRDLSFYAPQKEVKRFQSTRPRRGAIKFVSACGYRVDVSIHAPPEGRDVRTRLFSADVMFVSIHAPPEGRDCMASWDNCLWFWFQSTRPRRGAISIIWYGLTWSAVSIHAPPEGRDTFRLRLASLKTCFNPRAPGGARSLSLLRQRRLILFQSTRPRRGAIPYLFLLPHHATVSIHAPPEGRDYWRSFTLRGLKLFQSTRPRRGAMYS